MIRYTQTEQLNATRLCYQWQKCGISYAQLKGHKWIISFVCAFTDTTETQFILNATFI